MNQQTTNSQGIAGLEKLLLMLSLALCSFLNSLINLSFGPFLPVMARDLGVSISLVGQIPASMALLASVLSLASLTLCTLCISLATTFVFLAMAVLLGVLSRAITNPVAQAVAGEAFVDAERRRALSSMTAGLSGAAVIGVPILTSIDAGFGWHGAFFALALMAAANLALVARTVPSGASRPPKAGGLRFGEVMAGYRAVLSHRPTLGLISGWALSIAGTYSIFTYLGAFLVQNHGFDTQRVGFVYMALGSGAMVGSVATGGRLGARPLRPLLTICRICLVPLLGIPLLLPLPAIAVVTLLTVAFFLLAVCNVCTVSLLSAETQTGRATTMAFGTASTTLGIGIGSALGGLVLSVSGYVLLGQVAMVLSVASVIVVWWLRPATNSR